MYKHAWIVPVLAVTFVGSAAFAVLTPEQQNCQKRVGIQGGIFLKRVMGAIEACRNKVSAGVLVTPDCVTEAATAKKISSAQTHLKASIAHSCPDSVVAGMTFGGECNGSWTSAQLGVCLVNTHKIQAMALAETAYATTSVLNSPLRTCQNTAAKSAFTFALKEHAILRQCKDAVSSGTLPVGTDCAALNAAALTKIHAQLAKKMSTKCTNTPVAFGVPCAGTLTGSVLTTCMLRSHSDGAEQMITVEYGSSVAGGTALAKLISDPADCVGGVLSRCRPGDYLMKNEKIRVIVQSIQRNLFGIGQFGGQIIDADLVRAPGDPDRDQFEEWSTSINIENTAHYTAITVLNDGSDGAPAVIRVTGVDDLLDFLNPSATVASLGFTFPAAADDKDLPVEIQTDYILKPGRPYVRVETTVHNTSGSKLKIFFGEFLGGSGKIAEFQPAYGFGEPLATTRCPATAANPCNAIVYEGFDEGTGVSYGYINDDPSSSTFSTSGVSVPLIGSELLFTLTGVQGPPHTIEANGDPGDSKTFTQHFIVGNGTVSSILDTRNEIQFLATGTLQGTVMAGGSPAAGAQVAVLGDKTEGPGVAALDKNVVSHTLTDASGHYSLTLPPGNYNVMANLEGYPYEGGGASPTQHPVAIGADTVTTQDMALPHTGLLHVTAKDVSLNPIAAKVSVVGIDPSPDPQNTQSVLGLITNTTGVFNELSQDGLVYGLTQVHFAGPSGNIGPVPIEPGTYQVVVSHGPEYSAYSSPIVVAADDTSVVDAQVVHVVDSTGYISGDFHVHSIDSPDSKITRADRVVSMLAEGVDFFTPSDHDFRSNFLPTITALGAGNLIKTATSAEITTFDYGHFNAWPVPIDPSKVNGGSVDHGGAAPDGQDFPSYGNYSLTPAQIIHAARNDGATTVQINHVHSYFGLDGGSGLAIDTGLTPPHSAVPGAAHRLDPGVTNYFPDEPDRPDAFELWIGDDRSQVYTNFLGRNIGDWFNMLNQGILKTGVADSDTHKRIITQAGVPRSMVASVTDLPGSIDPADVSANVDAGRVVGTNAPIVRVSAHAASTGEDGGLGIGEPRTISTNNGEVDIEVDIQSPIWAEFDRVEYYVNTTTTKHTVTKESGAGTVTVPNYTITPDYVQNKGVDFPVDTVDDNLSIPGASHLEASTTLHLSGLTHDIWVVVLVRGTDGVSKPLFPVVPNSMLAKACSNDPCKVCTTNASCTSPGTCTVTNQTVGELTDGNLNQCGMTALAFTNPLFVDVDGGGWTPPGVQVSP